MSEATPSGRCPKCGAEIPGEAPHGLCPKCLLAQASISTEAGRSPAGKSPPPSREALTAAFPQLEILELIGQGGMGFVFKARQTKLDRLVALKILPQSLAADPAFAERFTREGRMLARLNHPNIVAVHDFGEAGGFFYLLMEYVDGVNLRQAMRAGRFAPAQALAVVPKICEALQVAHNEGILHRDIKPENILIDSKGRVKIADFGLAKLLGEARPDAQLTASGGTLGTAHYMAPEQIERPAAVDHRADIYSLGVVFYEMLTGELPLGKFAPPSRKVEVDVRLDEVVLHALEKEPEQRYQQASQVKTDVETIASSSGGSPPKSPAPRPDPNSNRFWKFLAAALGVLALAAFFAATRLDKKLESERVGNLTAEHAAEIATPSPATPPAELVMDRTHVRWMQTNNMGWSFKTLVPANQVAQWFLVFWDDGMPRIPSGFAGFAKVGSNPVVLEQTEIECEAVSNSPSGSAGIVQWNFSPGFGRTDATWFSNQPQYRELNLSTDRLRLQSGRQLVIPLAEFEPPALAPSNGWSGVELRVILHPLRRPIVRTNPEEYGDSSYLSGFGCADSDNYDDLLRSMKETPEERADVIPTDRFLKPLSQSIGNAARSAPAQPAEMVMDEAHRARSGHGLFWDFRSLIPPGQMAETFLVVWADGKPTIPGSLVAYVKTKDKPVVFDRPGISCQVRLGRTSPLGWPDWANSVLWQISPYPDGSYRCFFSNQPVDRKLDLASERLTVESGRQLIVPLVEFERPTNAMSNGWSGVELRVLLRPLSAPASLTTPEETDSPGYVMGYGFPNAESEDATLKLLDSIPSDRAKVIATEIRLNPNAGTAGNAEPSPPGRDQSSSTNLPLSYRWPESSNTETFLHEERPILSSTNLPSDLREAKVKLAEMRVDYDAKDPHLRAQASRVSELEALAARAPNLPQDLRDAIVKWTELTNVYGPDNSELRKQAARIDELSRLSGLDSSNVWSLIRQ